MAATFVGQQPQAPRFRSSSNSLGQLLAGRRQDRQLGLQEQQSEQQKVAFQIRQLDKLDAALDAKAATFGATMSKQQRDELERAKIPIRKKRAELLGFTGPTGPQLQTGEERQTRELGLSEQLAVEQQQPSGLVPGQTRGQVIAGPQAQVRRERASEKFGLDVRKTNVEIDKLDAQIKEINARTTQIGKDKPEKPLASTEINRLIKQLLSAHDNRVTQLRARVDALSEAGAPPSQIEPHIKALESAIADKGKAESDAFKKFGVDVIEPTGAEEADARTGITSELRKRNPRISEFGFNVTVGREAKFNDAPPEVQKQIIDGMVEAQLRARRGTTPSLAPANQEPSGARSFINDTLGQ